MSHGPISVFTGTIASGASTSGGIDLSRSWKTVQLLVPTMSTATAINMQAAVSATASYYGVYHHPINSATVAANPFVISNVVGTNGGIVEVPNGFQYVRFVATAVVSGGVVFKVICSD